MCCFLLVEDVDDGEDSNDGIVSIRLPWISDKN